MRKSLPTLFFLVSSALTLVGCSKYAENFNVDSGSKKFAGFVLGEPGGNFGTRPYEGMSFFKNSDGVFAEGAFNLTNNPVYRIKLDCSKVSKPAVIDGVGCGASKEQVETKLTGAVQLCSPSAFNKDMVFESRLFSKGNAYWLFNTKTGKVKELGLTDSIESVREEGEEPYSTEVCSAGWQETYKAKALAEQEQKDKAASAEKAMKEKFKTGVEYVWYHDGSCTASETKSCITPEDYQYLCKNNKGITEKAGARATSSWYDKIASHLYENGGSVDAIASWDGAQNRYKCRLKITVQGMYQGSINKRNIDAGISTFIVSKENEILVHNASPMD